MASAGSETTSRWRLADIVRSRAELLRIAPYLILSIFTAFCCVLSYTLNIWQDEAYSLHTSDGGIPRALQQGLQFEAQAPLYFVALAAWRLLNASVFHARLLSTGCILVALYTSWQFARRYLKTIDPALLLGMLAFNPFTVWAAVEIRPYAAIVMAAAILLYLFFRGFIDERPSRLARIAYVAVAIVAIYTQYYVALLLPANGVALLALRRQRPFLAYVVAMVPVAVALVPLAYIVPDQLKAYRAFAVAFSLPNYAMITAVLEYAFPHDWIVSWAHRPGLNALYIMAASVTIAIASFNIRRLSISSKILLISNATMFALFTAAIAVAHVHVLIPRHTIVMLVPVMLVALSVLGDVVPTRRILAVSTYVAVFTLFASLSFFHDYRSMSKLGDWKRVAAFVEVNATSSDVVMLFNAEAELPFRYYFRGNSVVRAIPRSMSFGSFDEDAFVLRDDRETADSVRRLYAGHSRIWLIESSVCSVNGDFFGCRRLEKYTREHFRTVRIVHFSGSTVTELVAKPQSRSRMLSSAVGV